NMPKPIICKINGVAAGAGCSLALASDILVIAEETFLVEVFVNIGLVMDSGSSYFLPRLVGSSKAFELATMGSRVYGKEAVGLGIANKSVPLTELGKAVKVYAEYYKNAPTKAIGLMKKMLNKSGNSNLKAMLEYEKQCQEIAGFTHDYKEGVDAFLEKRVAKFTGN
ncbi:MAG: enoyl-CoA hydratase-related protein, partial [Cyclobacteriaceae bacterium]|nr:enoyl-CoA hydratase-related protein [Cyclobacteriaceae bacterium]